MEAIKKLLSTNTDDQTTHGQENTTNTTDARHQKTGLTGEGSHLSGARDQPDITDKPLPSVPSSTTHNTGGFSGQGSHPSGAADSSVPGQSHSTGLGHESHDSSSAARDSTRQAEGLTGQGGHLPGSTTTGSTGHNTGGLTGQGSHLSGSRDNTTLGHQQSTGFGHDSSDLGATRHIGGGGLGHGQQERSDPTNMNTTAPGRSTGLGGDHSKTATGPHSSDMLNKVDPRVDTDQSRSTRASDQTGNYAGTGAGTGFGQREHGHSTDASHGNTSLPGHGIGQGQTTTGPHSSDTMNRADPRVDSDLSNNRRAANESGNFGGAGVGMANTGHREQHQSAGNPRGDTMLGQSTQSQTTKGPHSSDLMNKLDPRVDSDNSKNTNTGAGYSSSTGGSHHTGPIGSATSGPHQTNTANLLDPNINTSGSGHEDAIRHHERHGGGAEEADNDHRDSGKKAAVAGAVGLGAIGMGSESHQSRFTDRGADGSAGGNISMMPGTFPGEPEQLTGGDSHTGTQNVSGSSDRSQTANDPTSSAGNFQTGSQNVSGIPDRTRTTNDPESSVGEREHHHGRDAALVGGAAGLGGAAYGASRNTDSHASEPVHNSNILNRADPRVTTDNSRTGQSSTLQDRSHGIMTGNTTSHQTSQSTPHSSDNDNVRDQQHHHGRDAALGAGAAGAGYGLGRQHDSDPQGRSTTTSHQTSQTTSHPSGNDNIQDQQHHHGRDAALGAGAAGAGYGLGRQHDSQPQGSSSTTSHPQTTPHLSGNDKVRDQEHHHGRDPALGAGAAGAGYGLGRQHDSHPQGTSTTTTTTTNTSTSTAGPHSSDMLNRADPRVDSDRSKEQSRDHNYGRDAAIVGGAGAATIGAHQLDDREDKDLKQAEKDRKHAEKDQQRAQKQHDKSVHDHDKHEKDRAHEQKEHDKAVLAAEKERHHREQEREKQLRDNNKRDVKDEKHAEKEHKGLFSFLHRDKSKKYTQEEEEDFARQEREHNSSSSNTIVGAAAIGGSSLGDKLHGTARNRGIIGTTGFPEGGAPGESVNQHTGEPMGEHGSESRQTAPYSGQSNTAAHHDDNLHSHSRTGALGEGKQSTNEYNTSRGQQGDTLSPTTDSYTHSGPGSSTTHAQSSGTGAAPRHMTSEQKTTGSGDGVLDSDTRVKTTQGVHTGESHGVGVASGGDGRNRLHKDAPADRY